MVDANDEHEKIEKNVDQILDVNLYDMFIALTCCVGSITLLFICQGVFPLLNNDDLIVDLSLYILNVNLRRVKRRHLIRMDLRSLNYE